MTLAATQIRTLQARRRRVLRQLVLPPEALAGSLSQSHYRCGNRRCHCTQDSGHPKWSLTFMVDRKKRVAHVPATEVEAVRARVDAGNAYKRAVAELLAINAQLLTLERRVAAPPPAAPRRPRR